MKTQGPKIDRQVVKGLKKSLTLVGPLHKIILDADENVVAGVHRREAYPDWPSEVHPEIKTAKDKILVKIHENYRKVMSKKKIKEELLGFAEILIEEEGINPQEVCSRICDLVPYTPRYVQNLLPTKYKHAKNWMRTSSHGEDFQVILADPPWDYEFSTSSRGDPEVHYPTMSLKDICALKLPIDEDAILFLWATNPKLEESFEVIKAWGFEYRTNLCWVKDRIGTGFYVREQHELLLIAKKGSVSVPDEVNRPPSVLDSRRKEHSRKPKEVYEIIERMYPNQKRYLELFARPEEQRKGWVYWGDETSWGSELE